jgi:hypothetical protein
MRSLLFATAAATLVVTAQAIFGPEPMTLASDKLDIPYNNTLACGACVRAGYFYCIDKSDRERGRPRNDTCCDSYECVLFEMAYNNKYCATQNFTDPEYAYKDRTVMLQKFCGKRQNNTLCCPPKNKPKLTDDGGDDDDECEIEIKGKNVWDNVTISLEEVPYGGSCTYEVKAKCGYPQLVVNNTNIDMVVAFKKKEWDNDTYKPDDHDDYDDDEEWEGHKNDEGRIEYHMKEKEKHDHNDTDCQKVKMYITLTNLLNPSRPQLIESSLGEL